MKKRTVMAVGVAALLTAGAGAIVTAQPGNAAVITTTHTGSGAPALARTDTGLYVAWTSFSGTAAAKVLVIGYSTSNGQNITTLNTAERSLPGIGPALVADPDNPAGVVVAWADARSGGTLTATVYSGTSFGCRTSFAGLATRHSPALASDSSGKLYLAWVDLYAHLNVARLDTGACPTTHRLALTGRTVLPQTAAYGPGLVYDTTGPNLGLLLAWVAPNAAHSLTVASWVGSTTLDRVTPVDIAGAYPTSGPTLVSDGSDLYLAFRASDSHEHFGYSEGCLPTCFLPGDIGTAVSSGIGANPQGRTYGWFDPTGNLVIDTWFVS